MVHARLLQRPTSLFLSIYPQPLYALNYVHFHTVWSFPLSVLILQLLSLFLSFSSQRMKHSSSFSLNIINYSFWPSLPWPSLSSFSILCSLSTYLPTFYLDLFHQQLQSSFSLFLTLFTTITFPTPIRGQIFL